jgi:hypothetical protein
LTTGDFNGDGIEDLAVGAPGYTLDNMPQRGAVQIYFGSKDNKKCTFSFTTFYKEQHKFQKFH